MTWTRQTVGARQAEVARTLHEAGGNVARAAGFAGCSVPTYRQRARRAGVNLRRASLLHEQAAPSSIVPVPVPAAAGDAALTAAGVTLSLVDYASLQTAAAMGREAARLGARLDTAERIIATLTTHVERLAALTC